jgi:hypothetical protein
MFGPLSRTPPQHPVHGPFDLVGYSCWLQKGPHNSSGSLKCMSSTGCVPIHYLKHSFYSQTHPIIIYFKDAKMFRCNYYTNINMFSNNKYIRLKNMYNKCTKNLYLGPHNSSGSLKCMSSTGCVPIHYF